jgi:hypothetical protein
MNAPEDSFEICVNQESETEITSYHWKRVTQPFRGSDGDSTEGSPVGIEQGVVKVGSTIE